MNDTANYRIECPCGMTDDFRSEVVAETFLAAHDETCFNTPRIEDLTDE